MTGYEQAVRVRGAATVGERRLDVHGLGQRGHSWGAPDWERIASPAASPAGWVRTWLSRPVAIRPAKGKAHADELVAATLLEAGDDGGEDAGSGGPVARAVEDPRLTTTYDSEGRQRHAGLELWVGQGRPTPVAHRRRGDLRHVAGPRTPAPGLRVFSAGTGAAGRASGATTSCAAPRATEPSRQLLEPRRSQR
jgi:hypothetical protein